MDRHCRLAGTPLETPVSRAGGTLPARLGCLRHSAGGCFGRVSCVTSGNGIAATAAAMGGGAVDGLEAMIHRVVSGEEIARFQRDGYLTVRNFLGREQIAQIVRWTVELEMAREVSGRHWVYREDSITVPGRRVIQRIENFCPYHEGFDKLVREGELPRWVGALMGGPVVLFKDKINFKMPGGAGFKAHQDQQAGWSTYAALFVTAMVTLDPSTRENGCLEIAAGRHREGLIGHQWVPLEEAGLDLRPVPTAPGDVIFFDSFVPHSSSANLTDAPRRILYLTYNLASEGDHRARYFADKHASFPPDIDRDKEKSYVFRV